MSGRESQRGRNNDCSLIALQVASSFGRIFLKRSKTGVSEPGGSKVEFETPPVFDDTRPSRGTFTQSLRVETQAHPVLPAHTQATALSGVTTTCEPSGLCAEGGGGGGFTTTEEALNGFCSTRSPSSCNAGFSGFAESDANHSHGGFPDRLAYEAPNQKSG
jgi:hypothetical protein